MNNKPIAHKLRISLIRMWDFESIGLRTNLRACRKKREVKRVNGSKVMRVLVRTNDKTTQQENSLSGGRRRRPLEKSVFARCLI
ncbi:hypothetical protein HanHA89_Chr03g0109971 [Helianthus annuus]|nr:hypothetical protein HanHA89_Chr03g0109971 [Helianthus annuus]